MTEPAPMAWPEPLESREAKLEPFEWYRRMHDEAPLRYDETRACWDVFSHEAVTAVLSDPETFSSVTLPDDQGSGLPSMLNADPPQHTRLREPVEEFFQPGAVRGMAPEIEATTRTLLEDAETGDGRIDVVDDLAWPLPIHTIAALLGVPAEDRAQFKAWSDAVVAGPQLTDGDIAELETHRSEAAVELAEYFAAVCAERREDPGDDLISRVLTETSLTDMEVLGLFRLLLIAGNVTTTNMITNTVWCLDGAAELDAVRDDLDLLGSAIEEALRYRSPVQRTVRRATTGTELFGRRIEADDRLAVWIGAANRDPDRFADADSFVVDRSPNPHVAFGRGIHVCLGAPLARLESRIALETLLSRYGRLERVATDHDPVASPFIYGVQQFPVAVGSRGAG